jgi:Mg2+ and Co2+ transporter CorA
LYVSQSALVRPSYAHKIQQANDESELFTRTRANLQATSSRNKARDKDDTLKRLTYELLDISEEVDLVNDIKDIYDELGMIHRVFEMQSEVLQQLEEIIAYRDPNSTSQTDKVPMSALSALNNLMTRLDQRKLKISELHQLAARTHKALINLFDLKQNQANVLEAHYSRKVSQDSERNSVAILVFTVSGAIFLPLTFMAQFYALSITEWPRDSTGAVDMPLSYVSARVFGIGFGIAVILVIAAFSLNYFILESPYARALRFWEARKDTQGFGAGSSGNLVAEKKLVTYRPDPVTDREETASIMSRSPASAWSSRRTSRTSKASSSDSNDSKRGFWGSLSDIRRRRAGGSGPLETVTEEPKADAEA